MAASPHQTAKCLADKIFDQLMAAAHLLEPFAVLERIST